MIVEDTGLRFLHNPRDRFHQALRGYKRAQKKDRDYTIRDTWYGWGYQMYGVYGDIERDVLRNLFDNERERIIKLRGETK